MEYSLEPTEFIVKIDKVESSTGINALIFYTSAGRKHIVKGKNTEIDPSKFSEEKIFAINPTYQRWEWHEAEAKKYGYTLASIADSGESNKISNLLRQYGFGSAWAGGRRTRRGRSRGSDSWKWVDGSPWNYTVLVVESLMIVVEVIIYKSQVWSMIYFIINCLFKVQHVIVKFVTSVFRWKFLDLIVLMI